jgi:cell wall-associated NlpC family hydrolase
MSLATRHRITQFLPHSGTPLKHAALAVVLLCASTLALAQNEPKDDLDTFIANKGLVAKLGERVSQAGRIVSDRTSQLVMNAMGFLGVPYKMGGNGPEYGGFDCSGFVKAIYQQTIGHVLPRRAAEQAAATQAIDKSELQPGDLVFFNTLKSAFSHVGIYVGDNKFIHSPRSGSVVRVEDMRVGYWTSRFDGARRVKPTNATGNEATVAAPVQNLANLPLATTYPLPAADTAAAPTDTTIAP